MNLSFKPRVETLEGRMLMDAALPNLLEAPPPVAESLIASPDDGSFAGRTIRLRIATTNNQAPDSDWKYVPVRRYLPAVEPELVDAAMTTVMFDSRPGSGILKSVDGGQTWDLQTTPEGSTLDDNSHGTHVAGTFVAVTNNAVATTHELGHILGFRHEHTRPE